MAKNVKQEVSNIKKCGFASHVTGRGIVPCGNHDHESECTKVPLRCKNTTVCGVCGFCQTDCVGHNGVKAELQTFGLQYVTTEGIRNG